MRTTFPRSADHVEPDAGTTETSESLYRRGLEHLQAGEWGAAVECFSELVKRDPGKDTYTRLLAEARLKARLGDRPPRRRKGTNVLRSRWVWVLFLLNLVLWLALFGRQLYQQQIVPSLKAHQATVRQQQMLNEASQLLIAGDLAQAQELYREVLKLGPDNTAAQAALEEIDRRRQLAQSYDKAMTLIEQEDLDSALATLEAIRQEDPSFRDVQEQIERVRKMREKAVAFQQADQLARSGDLGLAAQQLLTLKEEAPDYKPQAVNKLLVDIYMRQAQAAMSEVVEGTSQDIGQLKQEIGSLSELVRGTTREIEQLQQAIQFFSKALEIDPADQDAVKQNQLAREYLAGLEAYRRGSWELASIHLANIYPVAPDYGNGRVSVLLQAAFIQTGNQYLQKEEYERAAERYRQAIAVGLTGDGLSVPDNAETLLPAADNLLRQKRYQEAIAIYAEILIKVGFQEVKSVVAESSTQPEADTRAWQRPTPVPTSPPASEGPEPGAPILAGSEGASAEPTPTPTVEVYVVRPNDTLGQIAQQFNTTVAALLEANDIIKNPNLIRPGWRLLISRP